MSLRPTLLMMAFLFAICASPALAGQIKCWTNKEGVRECGNVVPPEYAQQGHEVLNDQGITVDEVERARTKEEIAEQKRLEARRKKQEQLAKERAARDRVLLDTFANIDEMEMALDGKLIAIETEIQVTRKNMEKAKQRLQNLQTSAANMERTGKPVSQKLAKDLKETETQIEDYREFIKAKEEERERTKEKFAKDMERFRELRSKQSRR